VNSVVVERWKGGMEHEMRKLIDLEEVEVGPRLGLLLE
jgi:hypothetical protein